MIGDDGVEAKAPDFLTGDRPIHAGASPRGDGGGLEDDISAVAADCADDGRYEIMLVAPPLNIPGAVGSPLNPIAIK